MRLFLFGEDVSCLHVRFSEQLIRARGEPLLEHFFFQSANALRHEIAALPAIDRHEVPPFTTLDELNLRIQSPSIHEGVQSALHYISSIASYIR